MKTNTGIITLCLLTIVLSTLKLIGLISLSWFWVFAPIWISTVVAGTILFAIFMWIVVYTKTIKKF